MERGGGWEEGVSLLVILPSSDFTLILGGDGGGSQFSAKEEYWGSRYF